MPSGGAGRGQGRRPNVSPEDAALIREDCEQRARAEQTKQAHRILDRQLAKRGLVWEEDGEPNPIDLPDHYLRYRAIVSEYGSLNPEKKIPEDLPEEVKYAIDTMRANKKARGKRQFYSTPLPGLYRQRQAIIKAVAESWGVSPRAVRSIWEAEPNV
jgi:hypothetical protein